MIHTKAHHLMEARMKTKQNLLTVCIIVWCKLSQNVTLCDSESYAAGSIAVYVFSLFNSEKYTKRNVLRDKIRDRERKFGDRILMT